MWKYRFCGVIGAGKSAPWVGGGIIISNQNNAQGQAIESVLKNDLINILPLILDEGECKFHNKHAPILQNSSL